ncbi:major facilitator superfamily domain-containing protein [Mycena maculata]|uniref:Major facilitator superfamily domain-containing protein n=1 Tax=Mycena maculata TaxID=230809 RepID=A0AAD7JUJ0_9AGAR|nr:major facilitator superfamily domain-containing protein [Mycena maculata]
MESAVPPSTAGGHDAEASLLADSRARRTSLERRIIRRVDWRLLPILGVLYALALIDRTNISIARVVGLDEDLGLSIGSRFSIVVGIYFVPYTLFQLPSNLLLRKVGPRRLLSFCVVAWGAAQLAMGFVPNWQLLTFLRALLGTLEAGFFPSLVYMISTWYTRHEVQTRLAIFYVVAIVLGGFSAFFAYVLSLLSGILGLAGWAWIFIVEGALTIAFGILAWFFLPGFPDRNGFLSVEETLIVLDRVQADRGDSLPDVLTWKKFVSAFDWRVGAYATMFLCGTISTYGVGFFVTLILRGLGWSVSASLLLSAPPFVFAGISTVFFSRLSDRYRQRAPFIAFQCLAAIAGWTLTGFAPSGLWRYAGKRPQLSLSACIILLISYRPGLFLSNAGSSGCVIGILAYSSNNIVSHSKRAIVSSVVISAGGVGGLVASNIFTQASAPRYLPGIIITIISQVVLLAVLGTTTVYFRHQNARAVRESAQLEGHRGFLYTL